MGTKVKVFKETDPYLMGQYGEKVTRTVLSEAQARLKILCRENVHESRAVKTHTVRTIYPTASLYFALLKAGIARDEALHFMDVTCSKRAEPKAASMQAMCRIPRMYKRMPAIFKWVARNQFGEAAGFQATFYDMGKDRCKFDMTKCLYCDVCARLGCPELTKCFCHTDDVTDGNIHPRLLWNRTKVMGEGGDVCDFDLMVTEKP